MILVMYVMMDSMSSFENLYIGWMNKLIHGKKPSLN